MINMLKNTIWCTYTASPATWELLQSYGWSCLPNKSAADSDSAVAADGIAAAAEGTKATLAGEFEAEN